MSSEISHTRGGGLEMAKVRCSVAVLDLVLERDGGLFFTVSWLTAVHTHSLWYPVNTLEDDADRPQTSPW